MKRYLYIILFAAMLAIAGCGTASGSSEDTDVNQTGEETENSIYIYYVDNEKIVSGDNLYQIKQPDSLPLSVEEILGEMKAYLGDETLSLNTYMVDGDNNLSLEFSCENELSREEVLLTKACICKTLFQLPAIEKIEITIKNSDDKSESETFDRNSFFEY